MAGQEGKQVKRLGKLISLLACISLYVFFALGSTEESEEEVSDGTYLKNYETTVYYNGTNNSGTYTGEALDGIPSGKGVWTSDDKKWIYDGIWKEGLLAGYTEVTFPNGEVYRGNINGSHISDNKLYWGEHWEYIFDFDNMWTSYSGKVYLDGELYGTANIVKGDVTNIVKTVEDKPTTSTYDPSKIYVYIPQNGGTKYHSNSSCSRMKNPIMVTLEQAQKAGYTGCEKCN